jgi:hypothetical protein
VTRLTQAQLKAALATRQQSPAAAQAAYRAAARRGPVAVPADPQERCEGGPAAPRFVADMMTRCASCPPWCDAPKAEHELEDDRRSKRYGQRLYCSRMDRDHGRCPCERFTPLEGGHHDPTT